MSPINPAATTPQRIEVLVQGASYRMECNVCGQTGLTRSNAEAVREDAAKHRAANEKCRVLA